MHLTRLQTAIVAVAIFVTVSFAWRAGAQNGVQPPPPSRIAAIDIPRLIGALDERAPREQQLQSFINDLNDQLTARGDEFETATADMQLLVAGTPERRRKAEEVARMRVDLEVQGRWSEQLIDRRRAEVFADLFEKVRDSATKIAQQRGYDLVISSDFEGDIPRDQEAQIRSVMSARRVLYVSPDLDITDDVVRLMNNEWHAGMANRP